MLNGLSLFSKSNFINIVRRLCVVFIFFLKDVPVVSSFFPTKIIVGIRLGKYEY